MSAKAASPTPKSRHSHNRSRSPRHDRRDRMDGYEGRDSHPGRDNSHRDRNMDDRSRDGDRAERESGRRSDQKANTDSYRQNEDREDRPRPKKKNLGGFSYKDKRRDEGRDDRDDDRRGGSFRGYRDRSRSPRRRDRDEKPSKPKVTDTSKPPTRPAAAKPAVPQERMITIWVNDRLGTKKEVPCFPSDTVGQFKIVVAALIGRKPQQIVLQRQGERPLKDMITIADYQIKSGSQLDLEVGTAD